MPTKTTYADWDKRQAEVDRATSARATGVRVYPDGQTVGADGHTVPTRARIVATYPDPATDAQAAAAPPQKQASANADAHAQAK